MKRSTRRGALTVGLLAVCTLAPADLGPVFAAFRAIAQAAAAPATYMSEAELNGALKEAAKSAPAMHTAPVKNADHYRINLVRRTTAAGAIAHPDGTEVHHIVDGGGTLVTGGTIMRPTTAGGRGSAGATIEGGVSRHVARAFSIFM